MGFAIFDPQSRLCRPLPVWKRRGLKADLEHIQKILEAEKIEAFVIGVPVTDNKESLSLQNAEFWVKTLDEKFKLPLWTSDETMSSFEAEEALRNRKEKNKGDKRDSWAAAFFLEAFVRDSKT